jgi:hypothetical protein
MAKEIELEVFRVGGPASRFVTAEHIAEVARHDCEAHPVPVCFGHPKSDTPAAGTISKLRADGNSLFATVKSFTDKAIDGIKNGEWINRSFAFFDPTHEANPTRGKWAPRHLGLLGGAAPGIPGMGSLQKALAFDAAEDAVTVDGDPADAVIYAGKPTPVHFIAEPEEKPAVADKTPEQIADENRLAEERRQFQAERDAFAAAQTRQFEGANATSVDALVAAGRVLPAEAASLKLVFNALGRDELEFGAADKSDKATPAAKLVAFITGAIGNKRVPVDEPRRSPSGEFTATGQDKDGKVTVGSLTAAARKLMKEDSSLTFEAAMDQVSNGGEAGVE